MRSIRIVVILYFTRTTTIQHIYVHNSIHYTTNKYYFEKIYQNNTRLNHEEF